MEDLEELTGHFCLSLSLAFTFAGLQISRKKVSCYFVREEMHLLSLTHTVVTNLWSMRVLPLAV